MSRDGRGDWVDGRYLDLNPNHQVPLGSEDELRKAEKGLDDRLHWISSTSGSPAISSYSS